MNTYSLEQAASIILGPGPDDAHPESSKVQWLAKRLRDGRLTGYKAGRRWRLTETDITFAINALRPRHMPAVPAPSSMTATSRRRLAS